VSLLKAGKYDQVSKTVSNRVSDLLECEPIESLLRHVGERGVKSYVESELIKLAANVNVNQALNLKDFQVPIIADHLIQNYKWESLEDFTLCFRRAAAGIYGEIFRIDGAVIGQWMSRYLDEKYDALEQKKRKQAEQEKKPVQRGFSDHADKCINQILENLGAPKVEENNAKENEYQRMKMAYTPPGPEYLKMIELKEQYGRECRCPRTGKPLPGKPETFDEWLKLKTIE
jgi:hypothetical protein